jgi:CRP-like cAMP-binding protein
MDSKKELVGKQLSLMKTYLVLKAVPNELRQRILEYHDYLFTSSAAFADMHMFARMPPALTAQLDLATNRKLIARTAFFRDVSDATLVRLISELSPLVCVPGQLICVRGHPLVACYFIHRGRVRLDSERTHGEPTQLLSNSDNFGFEDYIVGCVQDVRPLYSASATSITYCDVVSLDGEALGEVLSDDPTFAQAIGRMRKSSRRSTEEERRAKGNGVANAVLRAGGLSMARRAFTRRCASQTAGSPGDAADQPGGATAEAPAAANGSRSTDDIGDGGDDPLIAATALERLQAFDARLKAEAEPPPLKESTNAGLQA